MHPLQSSDQAIGRIDQLVHFSAEGAALGESHFAARRLTQHRGTASTNNDRLCMRKDGRNRQTTVALHVHKIRVWRLNESFELVLPRFRLLRRVEQVTL
jgi:hypothetical protein